MDRPRSRIFSAWRLIAALVAAVLLLAPGAAAFRQALPGYRFSFPRDHCSHPDYRTEWWYLTGHLSTPNGRRFGYQLTFFRSALKGAVGADSARQVYFAHFAVGDIGAKKFHFFEKMSRGGLGVAGAAPDRLRVWNDGWLLEGKQGPERIRAEAPGLILELDLAALKPVTVQGQDGVSRKGQEPGHASHYYSITRLRSRGTLTLAGRKVEVRGLSWMDHEFSSDQLTPEQKGWDWFSVQLDDGTDLMLYVIRLTDGRPDPASSGSLIDAAGHKTHLPLAAFRVEPLGSWRSPHTKATYPSGWRLSLPGQALELDITPELEDQELATRQSKITYWEGACRVSGTRGGKKVSGQAFVELTGYAGKLRF